MTQVGARAAQYDTVLQPGLSFDQAPPFAAPLRFFLTAPVFGVLAGLLLAWTGPDALASRWLPGTLALTHLLTLGFMAMVMMGALLQMLPVVAGARVPAPLLLATVVHAFLVAGTLSLAAGFLLADPRWLRGGAVLVSVAVAAFTVVAGYAAIRAPAATPTVAGMRLALAALPVTAGLGVALVSVLSGWSAETPLQALTNLHLGWGFAGWVGLLVIGVAYQVVPMFQMTPPYPVPMTRWLAPAMFATLCAWTAVRVLLPGEETAVLLEAGLALGAAAFAGQTLRLQQQRKRRIADATLLFWRVGMASLIAAAALRLAGLAFPGAQESERSPVLLGVLLTAGFAVSVINGMLYKIVPFLAWFHLQPLSLGRGTVPNMKEILPDRVCMGQFRAHCAALALLLAAALWPDWLARPAGVALALSCGWLGWNLLWAWRVYRNTKARLIAAKP